jgi:hypothetical protein
VLLSCNANETISTAGLLFGFQGTPVRIPLFRSIASKHHTSTRAYDLEKNPVSHKATLFVAQPRSRFAEMSSSEAIQTQRVPIADCIREANTATGEYILECPAPNCIACQTEARWECAFPDPATRPPFPMYMTEMFVDARMQQFEVKSRHWAQQLEKELDAKRTSENEEGLFVLRFPTVFNVARVMGVQLWTRSFIKQLKQDTAKTRTQSSATGSLLFDELLAQLKTCDYKTHFPIAIIINNEQAFLRNIPHDEDVRIQQALHKSKGKLPTLTERLAIVRWCCQQHFFKDPRAQKQGESEVERFEPCMKEKPDDATVPMQD